MKEEQINIFDSVPELCKEVTVLLQKITESSESVNVALSGGTTPNALFAYWVEFTHEIIDWKRISFFWVDERCVPPDDVMSNYGTACKFLFDKMPEISKENVYRIIGENNPVTESVRYGKLLEEKLPSKNGAPIFDLVLLGMGNDGHTASIFPDQIDLWNANSNCVVSVHPESGMKRVGLTGRVVNSARNVAFMVTGTSKANMLQEVINKREISKLVYPAALVNPKDANLYWFLDKEAAELL